MSGKKSVIAVLAVILFILGAFASAQDEKNEVTGMIGRIFISDQGIQGATFFNPLVRSGNGLTFEVNYARRLLATPIFAVSGEVPAVFNLDEKLNSGGNVVPSKYSQIFITPSARLSLFPETAVSPWVSLGGGFAHFTEGDNLVYGGPNPGSSSTSGVLQGGFGLDVRVWHRFSIRGQVRDFWSGTPNFPLADTGKTRQHNYFVGGGVVWHF
jgi:Outer membrane protein beta-barrel domain